MKCYLLDVNNLFTNNQKIELNLKKYASII